MPYLTPKLASPKLQMKRPPRLWQWLDGSSHATIKAHSQGLNRADGRNIPMMLTEVWLIRCLKVWYDVARKIWKTGSITVGLNYLIPYVMDNIISLKSRSLLLSVTVLEFIQTVKEYKGRGAASLMMRYGCDMADNDGLEIYVDASMEGYPVYLKYGFVLKGEEAMPGGYIQRHLVRPARKH